jgi:hypothetical protein
MPTIARGVLFLAQEGSEPQPSLLASRVRSDGWACPSSLPASSMVTRTAEAATSQNCPSRTYPKQALRVRICHRGDDPNTAWLWGLPAMEAMSELSDVPGREHDLEQLVGECRTVAERARGGRVLFVAGGASSGRAVLLRALADQLAARDAVRWCWRAASPRGAMRRAMRTRQLLSGCLKCSSTWATLENGPRAC